MKIKTKQKTTTVEPIDNSPSIETEDKDLAKLALGELIIRAGKLTELEEALNAELAEDPKFQELKAYQVARDETLKALKLVMVTGVEGKDSRTEKSGKFAAELSAAKIKRTVNDKLGVANALDEIQDGLAIELANFGITDLAKHLTGALQDEFIDSEHSGARTLKVERVG